MFFLLLLLKIRIHSSIFCIREKVFLFQEMFNDKRPFLNDKHIRFLRTDCDVIYVFL